jgi:hypothetical protein
MCSHTNRTGVGSSYSKQEKPDYLVWQAGWLGFCRLRWQSGAPPALDEGASPPTKRCLDRRWSRAMATQGVEAVDTRSNLLKEEKPKKPG